MGGPVGVTWARTLGAARSALTSSLAIGGFLSAVGLMFSFALESAEGSRMTVLSVWASCVAPALPVLAAVLGMDVWSEERHSGRVEMLLSVAVRESDYVIGKFLSVLTLVFVSVLMSLIGTVAVLWVFSPSAVAGVGLDGAVLAVLGLMVQGVLWSAVSVMVSSMFASPALAAVVSVALMVVVPRGAWLGLMSWSPEGRIAFGDFPFDAQALDMAAGVFPVSVVGSFLLCAGVALFVSTRCVGALRLIGSGAAKARLATLVTIVLAVGFAVLSVMLSLALDLTADVPIGASATAISPRTRGILSESDGTVTVTCFLPRDDVRFRSVARTMRLIRREAKSLGGARFELRFVDPRWDIGAAERLVRRGVADSGLVFEKGRRLVAVPFDEGYGERAWASAIRRISAIHRRSNVYWTVGHGERRFDDYGTFGMSDVARDLVREGYVNRPIDLASASQIPGDCALIVVAGAKDAFSRAELERIGLYLREGGRLLVLLGSAGEEGVSSVLPSWGVRPVKASVAAPTLSGSDVIVSDFPRHPISASLGGSRIVLERPVAFVPSAAAGETGLGADRIDCAPIAGVADNALAVAVERGGGAGRDLAIRPTRIVVIGDSSFALNGSLVTRANANREFFLNCVAFLAGVDIPGAQGPVGDVLLVGMDRARRFRYMVHSACVVPGVVIFLLIAELLRRRRRR